MAQDIHMNKSTLLGERKEYLQQIHRHLLDPLSSVTVAQGVAIDCCPSKSIHHSDDSSAQSGRASSPLHSRSSQCVRDTFRKRVEKCYCWILASTFQYTKSPKKRQGFLQSSSELLTRVHSETHWQRTSCESGSSHLASIMSLLGCLRPLSLCTALSKMEGNAGLPYKDKIHP